MVLFSFLFSQAYFQRGLTKMKLNLSKGVHDFNRTLVHKPKFYQVTSNVFLVMELFFKFDFKNCLMLYKLYKFFLKAYLGRAAYYGSKKRYAKAIMNCNEALRLHPNSVRALVYR